jgi:hypothetical protein
VSICVAAWQHLNLGEKKMNRAILPRYMHAVE